MIKVSIITPTYNNKNKLAKNLDSIKNQIFRNIEHIIIDNLSNDGTEKIVKNYILKAGYPVIYIREKDAGIYNAMNKGVNASSGEWVHILNSDDYYYSNNSIEFVMNSNINEYDAVVSSIAVKHNNNSLTIWKSEFRQDINHYNFPHPGIIIKKEFYVKQGYYNEKYRIISDAIFAMENMPKAKYIILDRPLVVMAESGISNKVSWTKTYEGIIFNIKYYKGSKKNKIKFIILDLKRDFRISLVKIKQKIWNNLKK